MKQESNVLNPVVTVKLRGDRTIEVKELAWKDYLRAIKQMTESLLKLIANQKNKPANALEIASAEGSLIIDRDKLVQAIGEQEDLVAWVLQKSTGQSQEWVDQLSAADALAILDAVVSLNFTEEVIAAGKALAGRMGGVFALKTNSQKPATT